MSRSAIFASFPILLLGQLLGSPIAAAQPMANFASEAAPAQHVCRVGENGAPVLADRGLGGTGFQNDAPSSAPVSPSTNASVSPQQFADRGIGGTGISNQTTAPAPASKGGIGGTGIVGVITGFASVCLNGLEVGYDPGAPVIVDGSTESSDVLRAGQLAVLTAAGQGDTLSVASEMQIRHEVSGPVTRVDLSNHRMIIAGQPIMLSDEIWGDTGLQEGDWVAVSGLRLPDGTIQATRFDRRMPGRVLVRGLLVAGQSVHIGELIIRVPPWAAPNIGQYVKIFGHLNTDGSLTPEEIGLDSFVSDPASIFPPEVQQFAIEGYFEFGAGEVRMGGRRIDALRGAHSGPIGSRPSVLNMSRHGILLHADRIGVTPTQADTIAGSRDSGDAGTARGFGGSGDGSQNRGGRGGDGRSNGRGGNGRFGGSFGGDSQGGMQGGFPSGGGNSGGFPGNSQGGYQNDAPGGGSYQGGGFPGGSFPGGDGRSGDPRSGGR